MRILIVIPAQDRISGNWVTAERFRSGLERLGQRVLLYETPLQASADFRQQLLDFDPEVTILLHAYRSGKPWLQAGQGLQIPFLVLLTGTDVNHGLENPEQNPVIRSVLAKAATVLLQNPLIFAELKSGHAELSGNLRLLKPGIALGTSPYRLRQEHALPRDKTLFLCPAGLRPVKGVLELLLMFDPLARHRTDFQLAFCGPILDESYSAQFFTALQDRPWASYLGSINKEAMPSAMRDADVILNNSRSEGLANSLLEAASLGIPILAKRIPGNSAVVEHQKNGLLYGNDAEFIGYARELLDQNKRRQLSHPDPDRYHPQKEAVDLLAALQQAVETSDQPPRC